jgi:hypothetical protein
MLALRACFAFPHMRPTTYHLTFSRPRLLYAAYRLPLLTYHLRAQDRLLQLRQPRRKIANLSGELVERQTFRYL